MNMERAWWKIEQNQQVWQDDKGNERLSWPGLVQYTDGEVLVDTPDALPKGADQGYRYVVHDVEAKELLARVGLLYDLRHRGAKAGFKDNRSAPGA